MHSSLSKKKIYLQCLMTTNQYALPISKGGIKFSFEPMFSFKLNNKMNRFLNFYNWGVWFCPFF